MEKQGPKYVIPCLQNLYFKSGFKESDEQVLVNRFHNYIQKCREENIIAFPFIDEELLLNCDTIVGILWICNFEIEENKLIFFGNKMDGLCKIMQLLWDMLSSSSFLSVITRHWVVYCWDIGNKSKEQAIVSDWIPVELEKL